MTSLSSRFDLSLGITSCAIVGLASSVSAACAEFFGYQSLAYGAIGLSMVAETGLLVFVARDKTTKNQSESENAQSQVIGSIAAVCHEISQGNFEARITTIHDNASLADVQHKVNDMIDRCDAFVREATASLDAVCRNIYYRRILLGGLDGSFRVAAETINASVETQGKAVEKARREAAAEQAAIVNSLAHALEKLAAGDLSYRLNDFPEAYRQVRDDFNAAMTRLQDTIQAIAAATREVSNASAEISTGTTDLSQRTEEQAASLEQTSAAMEQMAGTVKLTADNAQHAKQSASSTQDVAERSGQVVAKAVEAMAKIEDSSRKISDIIGVIDEIARQTNLLALNAAVEAARAGEAGRGFAVVASEVRSLAQRSADAAKDIKNLIINSNDQVKDGVDLVNRTGTALTEIVESIKTVAKIVADIAHASGEQAIGIEQINKALNQMDEVTQQNSALVEESAATAKTLEYQAKAVDERVAFFSFEDTPSGRRAAA